MEKNELLPSDVLASMYLSHPYIVKTVGYGRQSLEQTTSDIIVYHDAGDDLYTLGTADKGYTDVVVLTPPDLFIYWVRDLLKAIQWTHWFGIFHDDFKATNITVQLTLFLVLILQR